jgi:hypothetical protein
MLASPHSDSNGGRSSITSPHIDIGDARLDDVAERASSDHGQQACSGAAIADAGKTQAALHGGGAIRPARVRKH